MTAKKVIARVLIVFVLLSVGFAVNREICRSRGGSSCGFGGGCGVGSVSIPLALTQPATAPTSQAGEKAEKVVVYYMHRTKRCYTCNRMETLTDAVVCGQFAEELSDGRLEWKRVNFEADRAAARRYGVNVNCVVVARRRGDEELGFDRLDQVWVKVRDGEAFAKYVGDAIRKSLEGGA